MTCFYNSKGRKCKYKFGDKVKNIEDINDNETYIVINAIWVGNTGGFWEVELETQDGTRIKIFRTSQFRKIGGIYE